MQYLVHIGYPKAASTWLQRTIFSGADPNIQPLDSPIKTRKYYQKSGGHLFYSFPRSNDDTNPTKIIHPFIFDAEKINNEIKSLTPSDANTICLSNELWTGHPFSGGIAGREFADRIHTILPNAKILIVIRSQEDMILSTYAHFLTKAGGLCSLERFLSSDSHNQIPWHTPVYYLYDRLVEYYINLFGRERVLVLPFEILKVNGYHEFLAPIYQFLELDLFDGFEETSSLNARDYKTYAIHRIFWWINILAKPHPANGNIGWGKGYASEAIINFVKMFLTEKKLSKILEKDKETISSFIKPYTIESNQRLQKQTEFNLQDLGYTI